MEDLENLGLKIDSCLPKLGTAKLILTLTQLGTNTERKQGIASNKIKLIRWIQKAYKDIMGDADKEPEEWKTTFHNLLFFVKMCEDNNTGVKHDISSREQQENNARTNHQEQKALQDVNYDNRTAQQQQNQYEVLLLSKETIYLSICYIYLLAI